MTRFLLLYHIFFFIIILINRVSFAQEEKQRDPFLSLSDEVKLSQKTQGISTLPYPIVINGIIWTENSRIAIINNDIVQEKDKWKDFTVERIEKKKVILRWGDDQFEINLVSEEDDAAKKD